MGKVIRASLLVLCLACSAQAGWIQNDVTGNPPSPPPNAVTEEQTVDGWIQNGEPESLTDTVLSVIESVLALL
jgi:hypothetical protein